MILRWNTTASGAEQVWRTSIATMGVAVDLTDGIETIDWSIYKQIRDRKHRIAVTDSQFDEIIASQNHICWGYINKAGDHTLCPASAVMARGNGDTHKGHMPSISNDVVIAQCVSCNLTQEKVDTNTGVYN